MYGTLLCYLIYNKQTILELPRLPLCLLKTDRQSNNKETENKQANNRLFCVASYPCRKYKILHSIYVNIKNTSESIALCLGR